MSVLNDTWRFLVQRQLWPVAILLVAAAVAVPMLLSEEPAPPAPAPTVAVKTSKEAVLAADPIVTQAADGDRSGRRQVLGSRKDPFKPQVTPTPTPKPARPRRPTPADCHGRRGGDPVRGRLARAGGHPAPASPPKKKVRALRADRALRPEQCTRPAPRRQAPPGPAVRRRARADLPGRARRQEDRGVHARLGHRRPGRRGLPAVPHHLRDHPHPRGRDRVLRRARRGWGAQRGRGPAQYQLDVLKIRKTSTTNAKKASAAKASVSKTGQKILRARIAGDGPSATATTSGRGGWRSSTRRPTRPWSPRPPRPPAPTSSVRPQRAPGESPAREPPL